MQDRILGPLTMVQFIYAVVGGGLCYAIYMSIPKPFSYLLVLPVALFTVAMVFLKINERPFLDFLVSVVQFFSTSRQRVWHHQNMQDLNIDVYRPKQSDKPAYQPKVLSKEDITQLAQKFDRASK